MTAGIDKDVVSRIEFTCTQSLNFCARFFDIFDHDVEMELLRTRRVWPCGRHMARSILERQTR